MFKSKSYNVEKVSKKNEKEKEKPSSSSSSSSSGTMTLKKKDKIKSVNNKESPEYRKKAPPKNVTSTKWVENKTYNKTDSK